MKIYVRHYSGRIIEMEVEKSWNVKKFKEAYEDLEGFGIDEQRPICGSSRLENHRTLEDCYIKEGSTINMVTRLEGG